MHRLNQSVPGGLLRSETFGQWWNRRRKETLGFVSTNGHFVSTNGHWLKLAQFQGAQILVQYLFRSAVGTLLADSGNLGEEPRATVKQNPFITVRTG